MFALPVPLEQPPSWPAFSKPALHSMLTAGIYCCCSDRAVVLFRERDAINVERLGQQLAWHSDSFSQVVAGVTTLWECAQRGLTVMVDRKYLRILTGSSTLSFAGVLLLSLLPVVC
jgi:hypothetical protein